MKRRSRLGRSSATSGVPSPEGFQAEAWYRKRKKELAVLSNGELRAAYERAAEPRRAAIAADVNDEASDSLYESPPIDSNERITYDLMKERGLL